MSEPDSDFLVSALEVTEPLVGLLSTRNPPDTSRLSRRDYIELSIIVHYIRSNAFQGLHYRCLETWLLLLVKFCRITDLVRQLPYIHQLVVNCKGVRLNSRLLQSSYHFQRQIDRWLDSRADRNAANACNLKQQEARGDWSFIFEHNPSPVKIAPHPGEGFWPIIQLMPYEDDTITDIDDLGTLSLTENERLAWRKSMVQDLVIPGASPVNGTARQIQKVLESFRWNANGIIAYRENQIRHSESIGDNTNIPAWEYTELARVSGDAQQKLLQSSSMPVADDPRSFFENVEQDTTKNLEELEDKVRGTALKSRQSRPGFGPARLSSQRRKTLEIAWKKLAGRHFEASSEEKPLVFGPTLEQEAFVFSGAQVVSLHRAGPDKNGREHVSLILKTTLPRGIVYARVSRTLFNKVANEKQVGEARNCPQTFGEFHDNFDPALAILDSKLNKRNEVTCMVVKRTQMTAATLSERMSYQLKGKITSIFSTEKDQNIISNAFDTTKMMREEEENEKGKAISYSQWKYCETGNSLMGHGVAVLMTRAALKER